MNKKILVVDGEPHTISSIARALGDEFQVQTAATGQQAIDLLNAGIFEIVISSVCLPDTTGLQLLSYVFGHHPNAARLLLTTDICTATEDSAFAELLKPCEPRRLATIIRDTIYWAKLHRSDASAACQSRN